DDTHRSHRKFQCVRAVRHADTVANAGESLVGCLENQDLVAQNERRALEDLIQPPSHLVEDLIGLDPEIDEWNPGHLATLPASRIAEPSADPVTATRVPPARKE